MRQFSRFLLVFCLLLIGMFGSTLGAFAQTPAPAPQIRITQVDNSKFPQVTVYVSVTDATGQPVGVDPGTIQISENGQTMKTTAANIPGSNGQTSNGPGSLTTMLVMDVSGSMATANKLALAKTAAKTYVDQMRPSDQAGLIAFDTHIEINQPVTPDHQVLIQAIDSLRSGTNTAMFDALIMAENSLAGIHGRKAILLLTDGLDNRSKNNADAVINAIGPSGLTISTIGLGNPQEIKSLQGIDEASLKSIAQRAGGIYTYEPDPSQLTSLFQQYGAVLQNEYALTYISPLTMHDGVNRTLSVGLTGSAVVAQSQYNPGGVLPEVSGQNWMLFAIVLLILVILLAAPALINFGMHSINRSNKRGRVKFASPPNNTSQKGHVKLK